MADTQSLFRATRVRELMTPNPVSLHADATVGQAMELMEQRRFRHMPVVDADQMLVGIISQRDILRLYWPTDDARKAASLTKAALIGDVMGRVVDAIGADDPVENAARYMLRTKRDSMPVVGPGGHLIGMLTAHDFLREVVRNAPQGAAPTAPDGAPGDEP